MMPIDLRTKDQKKEKDGYLKRDMDFEELILMMEREFELEVALDHKLWKVFETRTDKCIVTFDNKQEAEKYSKDLLVIK